MDSCHHILERLSDVRFDVPELNAYLRHLEIGVNYLSATQFDGEKSLSAYLEETVKQCHEYLPLDVKVGQIMYVWVTVRFMRAKALLRKNQVRLYIAAQIIAIIIWQYRIGIILQYKILKLQWYW